MTMKKCVRRSLWILTVLLALCWIIYGLNQMVLNPKSQNQKLEPAVSSLHAKTKQQVPVRTVVKPKPQNQGFEPTLSPVQAKAEPQAKWEMEPAWSRKGNKIAFVRANSWSGSGDIWVMNADGSEEKQLTSTPEDKGCPSWSPDGKKIIFHTTSPPRYRGIEPRLGPPPKTDIWVINADGSNLQQLTNDGHSSKPAWSPNGKKIAFVRAGTKMRYDANIWVMNPDGTGQKRLTTNDIPVLSRPSWSPNSKQIAFNLGGLQKLCIMNADGTNQRMLEVEGKTEHIGTNPAWSLSGKQFAIERNQNIWVVSAKGGNLRQVTNIKVPESKDFACSPC